MCCLAEFIVKYVLFIANFLFALAGIAIIILGSITHNQLNKIHDVIPVNLSFLTISVIVIGCIIFVIAFCACCGAIRESQCMLITYAVFMGILAAIKIYITVVIFKFLGNTMANVTDWLTTAFNNNNEGVTVAYNAMETLFQCCGTYGALSYPSNQKDIPPSCCNNPNMEVDVCTPSNSYEGCISKVGNYFDTFGEAIGGVMITIIIVECVCLIFAAFMACSIRNKRYR